jgi:hypothetical protein
MSYHNPANEPLLSEETFVTSDGTFLVNVHPIGPECAKGCVVHGPSDHHMNTWPTRWRHGGMFDIKPAHMERICKHGIGHPDPDSAAYLKNLGEDIIVHGCDGCCAGAYSRLNDA